MPPRRLGLAIVGLGKIARDQHVPALATSPDFELVAVASPNDTLPGVECHADLASLLATNRKLDAVAICTMPQARVALARMALEQGLHVLLEKPPGVSVAEVQSLQDIATRQGLSLLASWHSRHAPAVAAARSWLSERDIRKVHITWKEDVRAWHPGQRWLWEEGGLGVFDPGINALSILTSLLPGRLSVGSATLSIPQNCRTAIAAHLDLVGSAGIAVEMDLDFLQAGPPLWDIDIDTDRGTLVLSQGGHTMAIDGELVATARVDEYPGVYAHFAQLIRERRCDVDVAPLRLIEEAYRCGRHLEAPPFVE